MASWEPPYGSDEVTRRDTLAEVDAGLPDLPFVLHLDQVRALLGISEDELKRIGHRRGVDYGDAPLGKLTILNIAPTGDPEPMWRVDYRELRRWCRRNQIPTYQW